MSRNTPDASRSSGPVTVVPGPCRATRNRRSARLASDASSRAAAAAPPSSDFRAAREFHMASYDRFSRVTHTFKSAASLFSRLRFTVLPPAPDLLARRFFHRFRSDVHFHRVFPRSRAMSVQG